MVLLIADTADSVAVEEDLQTERRRGLRIRQSRPVKVFEPSIARYFGGQTQDISSAGLRVELPVSTPIRPGKLLNVHVGAAAGEALATHHHMLPARVVWIDRHQSQSRGRLVAGIEFLGRAAAVVDAA